MAKERNERVEIYSRIHFSCAKLVKFKINEIARETGINWETVKTCLDTLVAIGHLEKLPDGRYWFYGAVRLLNENRQLKQKLERIQAIINEK